MIDHLVTLIVLVAIVGICCLFLRWLFAKLAVPDVVQTIIWVLVALFVFLALIGLLGYGPGVGMMREPAWR